MALDPELLKILACPACKNSLSYDSQKGLLTCAACRREYPVRDNIPILLIEKEKSA